MINSLDALDTQTINQPVENALEQDVMGCQGILDDLRALTWRLDDRRVDLDPNDLADVIRGLETLYEIKFMKLWDTVQRLNKHQKP